MKLNCRGAALHVVIRWRTGSIPNWKIASLTNVIIRLQRNADIQSVEFCHESETRSNSFHWALFFLQLFRMICSRENRRRSVCDAQTHTGAAMHILYKSSRSPIKKKIPLLTIFIYRAQLQQEVDCWERVVCTVVEDKQSIN